MPSAARLFDIAERLFDDGFAVNDALCAKARNRNAGCAQCVESCPAGCLSFEGGSLVFDPDGCTSCAACVAACPTGALSRADVDESSFAELCAGACGMLGGTLVIACEGMLRRVSDLVDMTKVVSVPLPFCAVRRVDCRSSAACACTPRRAFARFLHRVRKESRG